MKELNLIEQISLIFPKFFLFCQFCEERSKQMITFQIGFPFLDIVSNFPYSLLDCHS